MLDRARLAFQKLAQVALPTEGSLTVVDSVEEATRDLEFVQNAPERLQLNSAASRASLPSGGTRDPDLFLDFEHSAIAIAGADSPS